jgi:hypothetical protein
MAELKTSKATKTQVPGFADNLISNLQSYKPQRPNFFDIEIGIPSGPGTVTPINFNPKGLPFGLAQSFTTPTREFEVKEFAYYGIKRKIPIRRKYGSFTLSFLQDDWFAINGWFEYWMDIIINPFNDYIEDYSPTISAGYVILTPVDDQFNYGGRYKFIEAYPIQILPIQFDATTRNSTMRYEIMFNCTEYVFEADGYTTSAKTKPS